MQFWSVACRAGQTIYAWQALGRFGTSRFREEAGMPLPVKAGDHCAWDAGCPEGLQPIYDARKRILQGLKLRSHSFRQLKGQALRSPPVARPLQNL